MSIDEVKFFTWVVVCWYGDFGIVFGSPLVGSSFVNFLFEVSLDSFVLFC